MQDFYLAEMRHSIIIKRMYSFDDFERLNSSVRMEMNNMFASITTEDKRMAEQMRHKFLNEIESSSELFAKEFHFFAAITY